MTGPTIDPADFNYDSSSRPNGWTLAQEIELLTTVPGGIPPDGLTAAQVARLVWVLRQMDLQQNITDQHGGRELAWVYWRDDVAALLGLDEGALNMDDHAERFTQ